MISHFLAEVLTEAHVLIKLMRQLRYRTIHESDIVDWMSFQKFNNGAKIGFPNKHMIVLKNKNKLVWDFTHDIPNIFCESTTFSPFLYQDSCIMLIFLFQASFEFQVILLRDSGYNPTFVLTSPVFDYFSTITDDIDDTIGESWLLFYAFNGHIDDIGSRIRSDGTGCYYNSHILKIYYPFVIHIYK
jgi:hypothetical protein